MKHQTFIFGLILTLSLIIFSKSVLAENERGIKKIERTGTPKVGERIKKNNSKANIKGVITALSENTLTVSSDGKTYTINISQSTQETQGTILKRRYLGKATSAEFSVNNKVKVMGTWTNDEHSVINASRIWNLSISKYRGAFVGTVQSIDSTTIVFDPVKRERHTAYLSATTKYLNRNLQSIVLTDIKIGHKVRIRGTWDKSNKKVFDVINVVDMSLPPLPTKTR